MQLLLIRHAQSQHNARETSDLDSGLTKWGKEQSTEVALFLKRAFDDIADWKGFTSPFLRTLQTSQIIKDHTKVDFEVNWDLHEYIHGSSGYTFGSKLVIPNRKNKFPSFFNSSPSSWSVHPEKDKDILARTMNFLDFVEKKGYDKVLLVSHAMPIYVMIYILQGTPMVPKWDRKILNTSVTWFENGTMRYFAKFVNSGDDPREDSFITML